MVTPRRTGRLKRQRIDDYTEHHRTFLRDAGIAWAHEVPGFVPDGTLNAAIGVRDANPEALRAAWSELGSSITEEWITEHPGTRPRLWWASSAPEKRRRRLTGPPVLYAEQPGNESHWWFGVPSAWSDSSEEPIEFESQPAFLARHGLLTDGERIKLGSYAETETVWGSWKGRLSQIG